MTAKQISLKSAKDDKLFYFVANVVVFREKDQRCLILKRDLREIVHPGKYGVIGGKLEWKDLDIKNPTRINGYVLDFQEAIEDLLEREAFEEAGIRIHRGLKYINSIAFVRPDGVPVIMAKFAAKYRSGKIVLEKGGFTDHQWVNEKEVNKFECIKGIDLEVKKAISLFSK